MEVRWNTKWRWDTGYSADSVEWCPVEGYRNVLVCGTYQLDKKDEGVEQATKQKRLGRIYLFNIDSATTELSPIQTIDTSGILDQKWCCHLVQNYPILAAVTSEGDLALYRLYIEEIYSLKLWVSYKLDQDILVLSLDWSTNKMNSGEVCLVVSDSSGHVTVLMLAEDEIQKVGVWKAHDYEAWIVGFNYWNPAVFYSGGDDCSFKCYDTRIPDLPVSSNKAHGAGVTAIRSHVQVEHQLLTGSYDEKVRLWDARTLKRCVSERDVNGGVWRLKWHPCENNTVLAACMYGGFRILTVEGTRVDVVSEYMEHESIAYGADWKHNGDSLIATCSFYDCRLHISELTKPNCCINN
ncbi:diphthine methyltransferase isoform X1 [Plodia interpunctella]|nr:diphthine methyltransferase isoform X1 [Plodia interpunctella]XP_053607399.1 diphthine methyltransferase isoform X1 [Plodia interpunctella]XP_053607400.1 diphthine methyltransferase isoform X1 [Plodia interpunctella]XP_053607401.1 diphthine methyltransferase isoform X1 [Plodia interpunctella]